jgi:hypothetical protein
VSFYGTAVVYAFTTATCIRYLTIISLVEYDYMKYLEKMEEIFIL